MRMQCARHGGWLSLLALTMVCVVGRPVGATVLWDLSIEELTEQADYVVMVDIGQQWVEFDEELTQTKTYTRFEVVEVLHASEGLEPIAPQGVIQQEGGMFEDRGVFVAGNAHLVPGERALLFLTRDEFYYVLGMELGKYNVSADQAAVERVYRNATVPVAERAIIGTELVIREPIAELNGTTLDSLAERIRRVGGEQ